MAPRTISGTEDQWERVAEKVIARRLHLGYTASELVTTGLSSSVLSLIENHKQTKYSTRTMAVLCEQLFWTPDSIHRILDGGEPEPLEEAYLDPDRTRAAMLANLELQPRRHRQRVHDMEVSAHDVRLTALERRVDAIEALLKTPRWRDSVDDEMGVPTARPPLRREPPATETAG